MAAAHASIIDWPFTTSTATAPEPTDLRATLPKTPYPPHNGYEQERLNRKRLITTLICLAIALLSDIVAITLYALVGEKEHRAEWLFRTWVVVSVGVSVMLALLAVSFWRNYVRVRRSDQSDCDKGTPLKAIGRKELQPESQSITRAPLMRKDLDGAVANSLSSPATVLHRYEAHQSPSSHFTNTPNQPPYHYTITAGHVLSPVSPPEINAGQVNSSLSHPSGTITPLGFPSRAVVRERATQTEDANEDIFYDSEQRNDSAGSPDSDSTIKAREAQLARSDSLKKLREATLRRKQAREQLK